VRRVLGRILLAALGAGALAAGAPPPAPAAPGHGWRRVLRRVIAFQTDGARYAAWEGEQGGIVVLDTNSGRTSAEARGCDLWGERPTAGRFLVLCGRIVELLDAWDGALRPLPEASEWRGVGRRYVWGRPAGPSPAHCNAHPTHDECIALYDIATGTLSAVAESRTVDIDRAGAPPVCPRLHEPFFHLQREEETETFAYAPGLLVRWVYHGERKVSEVALERCRGKRTILHSRPWPVGLQLGGGLLSWAALTPPEEEGEEPEFREKTHGELELYTLASGRRRTWPLPRTSMVFEGNAFPGRHVGVDGYALHVRRAVFWVGTVELGCGETGCYPTASDVFEAQP
jgi:hypothetical protein